MKSIDELIIRSLSGEASELEEYRLRQLRASSPLRDRHARELEKIWELGASLESDLESGPVPTIRELMERGGTAMPVPQPRGRGATTTRWTRRLVAAAAILILSIGVGQLLPLAGEVKPAFGVAEFVTGESEMVTVTLGDGSIIRLAPMSRLRVAASSEREVWLDGRAYFAISKRRGRNFRIRTHAGDALVLGTRFDLQARQDQIDLLVVEGSVQLTARGESVAVGASERGRAAATKPLTLERVEPNELLAELHWMGDFLAFEGTPLKQAVQELSQRYQIPIEILDRSLAEETVHGWFTDESLDQVLAVLCRAVRAHCSIQSDRVTIAP